MSLATMSRTQLVSDKQQYRLIFAASFLFFLVAAACGRVARRITGRARPHGTPRSLVAEARTAGSNAVLLAFLG